MRRTTARSAMIGVVLGLLVSPLLPLSAQASNNLGGANHWSDGSQPRAYVTISDFTPSGWPVLAATNTWATEPNIDVYYNFGGCGGTGHCVDVRLKNMAETCNQLRGFMDPAYSNGHYSQDSIVRFNDACSASQFTNQNRRSIACHELGHVMGLAHELNLSLSESCMVVPNNPPNWVNRTELPSNHDFNVLHNTIYTHND